MIPAQQIYSRAFDSRFFKLPIQVQERIQAGIDSLRKALLTHSHHRLSGVDAYRLRVGEYRIIYQMDRQKGILYLLSVGHRRDIYKQI